VEQDHRPSRNLTDADVVAIVDLMQKRWTEQFYQNIGQGVMKRVRDFMIVVLIAVAAYGYHQRTGS
jgi:hypothetical protein